MTAGRAGARGRRALERGRVDAAERLADLVEEAGGERSA